MPELNLLGNDAVTAPGLRHGDGLTFRILLGEPIGQPGVPESFNVLLKELQSLGLSVELLNQDDRPSLTQGISDDTDLYQPLEAI